MRGSEKTKTKAVKPTSVKPASIKPQDSLQDTERDASVVSTKDDS